MISIILPIRNEASFITNTLNAIIYQDYPVDKLEIIISDGMSDDGTHEIYSKANENFPIKFLKVDKILPLSSGKVQIIVHE